MNKKLLLCSFVTILSLSGCGSFSIDNAKDIDNNDSLLINDINSTTETQNHNQGESKQYNTFLDGHGNPVFIDENGHVKNTDKTVITETAFKETGTIDNFEFQILDVVCSDNIFDIGKISGAYDSWIKPTFEKWGPGSKYASLGVQVFNADGSVTSKFSKVLAFKIRVKNNANYKSVLEFGEDILLKKSHYENYYILQGIGLGYDKYRGNAYDFYGEYTINPGEELITTFALVINSNQNIEKMSNIYVDTQQILRSWSIEHPPEYNNLLSLNIKNGEFIGE